MINKNFNFYHSAQEKKLYSSLIRESIQIKGLDIKYLPRRAINPDQIHGEDLLSSFSEVYTIEMYIKTVENFEGEGDILTKWLVQIKDYVRLVVHKDRFERQLAPAGITRPMEGDLLYISLKPTLWEIKFVEDKSVFFQLGDLYVYEIRAEMFTFAEEHVDTQDEDITRILDSLTYSIELTIADGSGNYIPLETVYQGASVDDPTFSSTVVSWNATSKVLVVNDIVGEPVAGLALIGHSSQTSRLLSDAGSMHSINDTADAENIDAQSQEVIDRSEDTPFGSY